MTGLELVRKYFPDATDEQCDYILWKKTGYPSFFVGDPEEYFGRQLEKYRVAVKLGFDVCAGCGRIKHDVDFTCGDCNREMAAKK